jgi:S-adenosylmethionine-diacylglycerol 3-amino-3-carboxypropyl transferase
VASATTSVRRTTAQGLTTAVHRHKPLSAAGLRERMFTLAFRGLVYPQIWEDPRVDMEALDIKPGDRIATIASGGCNALSYLTAGPAAIDAVDLNGAHIALGRLKVCGLKHLPDHQAFLRFFGHADTPANLQAFDVLKPHLDETSRAYWEGRTSRGRRRITAFANNFYHYGLLGRFIGLTHLLARVYGLKPQRLLAARSRDEQRAIFAREIAPIFDKSFIRWLVRRPASLYGLGIPPAQYHALAGDGPGGIGAVLYERIERLACGFDIADNYFAAQAFGRAYARGPAASLPPYLDAAHFETLRATADRVRFIQSSMTDLLAAAPAASYDSFILLDAQDWMTDADLTALWTQMTRTARPGARVIFRTAADERLLPGRIPDALLAAWGYDAARSAAFTIADRSAIYGGFHLYTKLQPA